MNREKDTAATEEAWDHFDDRDISILQSFQRAFRQWEAERTIPVPEYLRDDLKRFNAWMPKIISALTVNTSTPGNDLAAYAGGRIGTQGSQIGTHAVGTNGGEGMIDRDDPDERMKRVCKAICKSGKFETGQGGCAAICMSMLGDSRKGCSYIVQVHGKLAGKIMAELE